MGAFAKDFNKTGSTNRTVIMVLVTIIGVLALADASVSLVESFTDSSAEARILVDDSQLNEIRTTEGGQATIVEANALVQTEAPLWIRLVSWLGFDALGLVAAWVAFLVILIVGSWPNLFTAANIKRLKLITFAAYAAFALQLISGFASITVQSLLDLEMLSAEGSFAFIGVLAGLIGLTKALEKAVELQIDNDLAV